MDFFISSAYAQAEGAAQPSLLQPFILLAIFFAIFYFIVLRPQQRQKAERERMLSAIKKGDKVVTQAGLIGELIEMDDRIAKVKSPRPSHDHG